MGFVFVGFVALFIALPRDTTTAQPVLFAHNVNVRANDVGAHANPPAPEGTDMAISGRAPRGHLPPRTARPPPTTPERIEPERIEPAAEAPRTDAPRPDAPFPEDALRPPAAPFLPIWAYRSWAPPPAPTTARRAFDKGAPTRAVQSLLRKHDRIGRTLTGAGRISALLRAAVRTRRPDGTEATFVARIASDGEVTAMHLASFSEDRDPWAGAAHDTLGALRGQVLRLPSHMPHGARVTVRVTQNRERPSGYGGERPPPPPKSVSEVKDSDGWKEWVPRPGRKAMREEPITSIQEILDLPDDPETMLRPCSTDGSGCLYWGFDPADFGSHKTRVIRTHVDLRAIEAPAAGPRR